MLQSTREKVGKFLEIFQSSKIFKIFMPFKEFQDFEGFLGL